ncbi:hypothetical protein BC832DRAFT_82564 [Gaertneriomyces semiglobifer]|nr:hypothetical protein BC832DRAFT_82564 [Gaertneriomyces semiglobifer]
MPQPSREGPVSAQALDTPIPTPKSTRKLSVGDPELNADSAYDSGIDEQQHQSNQRTPAAYDTPPPESKTSNSTRKRKRMGDDEVDVAVPPPNPRRKPPKRQLVFVDPDDSDSPWWWPAMIVPKSEYDIFKDSVNGEVKDPADGECVVVYFEDGSYNTIPESDIRTFCPYEAPYTTYAEGPNAKAFCADKAVILATAYWEEGRFPPMFGWLQDCPKEDRSRCARVFDESVVRGDVTPQPVQGRKRQAITSAGKRGPIVGNPTKKEKEPVAKEMKKVEKPGRRNGGAAPAANKVKPLPPTLGASTTSVSKSKALSAPSAHVQEEPDGPGVDASAEVASPVVPAAATPIRTQPSKRLREEPVRNCTKCGLGSATGHYGASGAQAGLSGSDGVRPIFLCGRCRQLLDRITLEPANEGVSYVYGKFVGLFRDLLKWATC